MPDTVVETKLLLPRLRPQAVARPRLTQLLGGHDQARLTVISAPAGFGKTTLLSEWLSTGATPGRTAWVSLDEQDRDATSFWAYVLRALDRAAPGSATAALVQYESGQVPIEKALAGLLNELSVLPDDLVVVLDDYHLADGPAVQQGMCYFLEHLPPQVWLIISTRADPALPLSRMRARGQLMEVRAADLRFTTGEVSSYLNRTHGLALTDSDVTALETRTEGWAAALQLAALSLQGRQDRSQFIENFAGADRFVVDYLADEVLDHQPAQVRRFLLDTCLLEQMTGPLCDAMTGRTDGRATLVSLERQNLFVVPLDDHRGWYRYHQLFADVLRSHLVAERPEEVAALHRRASAWFEQSAAPAPAVRHALAAGDADQAAALVEAAIPGLRRRRREAVIRRWVDALPADAPRNRPVLAVGLIGALTASNEFDGVEQRLDAVEQMMDRPREQLVVVDEREYSRVRALVATYRSALALRAGDLAGAERHADRALEQATADDLLTHAAASALTGIARWTDGDLQTAHRKYTVATDALRRAGYISDVLGCTITLTDIDITLGRLRQAQSLLEEALRLAESEDRDLAKTRGTADMLVGLSRIAWERGDLAAARDHLDRAEALGEAAGLPQNPYRWRTAMARLREAEGDSTSAVTLLEEAQRLYVGDYAPNVRPVAATHARLLAGLGDLAAAKAWASQQALDSDTELAYRYEYEHVTQAAVRLAEHDATGDTCVVNQAATLLDRLLVAAENGGRAATVLEILILRARAHRVAAEHHLALEVLERAVHLAEPEGWTTAFRGPLGAPAALLDELLDQHPGWGFLGQLAQAVTATRPSPSPHARPSAPAQDSVQLGVENLNPSAPLLVEPLSERELEVLRYLCSDLDGPAIARQMNVSLATVRTHTQHVYTKLGVNNRRAAVRHAHQLALFSSVRR